MRSTVLCGESLEMDIDKLELVRLTGAITGAYVSGNQTTQQNLPDRRDIDTQTYAVEQRAGNLGLIILPAARCL